jgi:fructokinase
MNTIKEVIIFGEVLFDVFESGEEKLGGAPFNVAWHLKGFGLEPLFISSIGCDERGKKVKTLMEKWQLKTDGIKELENYQTGVVNVYIDRKGPYFEIPYDQAFDHISIDINKNNLIAEGSNPLLYHGSLALRSEENINAINKLKSDLNPKIFVDINLRAPWWETSKILSLIRDAHYLKLNNYEIFDLFHVSINEKNLQELTNNYQLDCIILTKAEEGASIFTKNGDFFHAKKELENDLVDTVGAGDAFSAVAIYGLINNWEYKKILFSAVDFAAYICTIRGALPHERNIYEKFLNKWAQN